MIKCICGLPGSGKNQYATYLAIKYIKAGYKVYTSYPIITFVRSYKSFKMIPVTSYKIDKQKFLQGEFEQNSIIIFDEAYIDFFNMDWKSVGKEELKKYNGSRHLGLSLYYITQAPARISPYLRDVTDSFIWLEKKLFYNQITEYYELENVGKLVGKDIGQLSPKLVKRSKYFRKKRIYTSYDDRYLRDTILLDNTNDTQFELFKVPYRSIFKRLKEKFNRLIDFRTSI